jgi:BON domain-containing protein
MKYPIAITTVLFALGACAPEKPAESPPPKQGTTSVSVSPPTPNQQVPASPDIPEVGSTQTTGAEMTQAQPAPTSQPNPPPESLKPESTPSQRAITGSQPGASGPESAHDRTISAMVRHAIIYEPALYGVGVGGIEIKTNGGKVTLKGKVPTAEDRAMVEKRAREIRGVVDVDNQIVVTKK